MRRFLSLVLVFVLITAGSAFGQTVSKTPFSSFTKPDCGRYATILGSQTQVTAGTYSCTKVVVFPQFAVQNAVFEVWTFRVTASLPPLADQKGVSYTIMPGYYSSVGFSQPAGTTMCEQSMGCAQGFNSTIVPDAKTGGGKTWNFLTMASCSTGTTCDFLPNLGQGPMVGMITAPDLPTLEAVSNQLTFYYDNVAMNLHWTVPVTAINSRDAGSSWVAPYCQGSHGNEQKGCRTAFTVVNMAGFDQSVSVSVRDAFGKVWQQDTPMLLAAYPYNLSLYQAPDQLYNLSTNPTPEMLPGGWYAKTSDDFFGHNVEGNNTIIFQAKGPIMVQVFVSIDGVRYSSVPGSTF